MQWPFLSEPCFSCCFLSFLSAVVLDLWICSVQTSTFLLEIIAILQSLSQASVWFYFCLRLYLCVTRTFVGEQNWALFSFYDNRAFWYLTNIFSMLSYQRIRSCRVEFLHWNLHSVCLLCAICADCQYFRRRSCSYLLGIWPNGIGNKRHYSVCCRFNLNFAWLLSLSSDFFQYCGVHCWTHYIG